MHEFVLNAKLFLANETNPSGLVEEHELEMKVSEMSETNMTDVHISVC